MYKPSPPASPSPTPRSHTSHSRQSSLTSPGQQTIQFGDEERDRIRAEQSLRHQLEGFTLQDVDYDEYDEYSLEFGRNDYGYTPSKGSEGHPTGDTPLKGMMNGSTPAPPSSSRALLSKELDRLIGNKPVNPSPFNPSRFGGTTYEEPQLNHLNHSSARLPDLTGLTYATASPEKGSTHKLLSSKRTRLGREDENVILSSISNLEHKLSTLNAENAQSRQRVADLEDELIEARREVARARASSSQEVEEHWQAKYKALADEKRALEEMAKTLRSLVENLKSELNAQAKVIEELKQDRSANEAKLVDKDRQIGWLNGQVAKLNKDVDGLWKALNESKEKEQDKLRKERDALRDSELEKQREKEREMQMRQDQAEEVAAAAATTDAPVNTAAPAASADAPPKLVLRPFGSHLRPEPAPSSFFSPTRDRAARSYPLTESAEKTKDVEREERREREREREKEVPAINIEESSGTATPKTSKRGSKDRSGMYWSLPASSGKSMRRASVAPPPTPSLESKVHDDGFVEGLIERIGKSSSGWESKVPPQTVLARVVRELEDDFAHYKGIYGEMSEQFKVLDPASNANKRRVLTQHLHQVISVLESKISSLYQLLKYGDKSVSKTPSKKAAAAATAKS
ncbi:hypothetical protein E3P99_02187 [Wallemia hederae]|uniref:Cep57 centrosome microtubule-binding domain-containing protein n=1 Tax=Wallemia hederae TaxID=1540922 RepID=A0A4T0FLI1_9BASI|nr:hypothetical protein E3P99_02187 [Wallemia hederae]